MAPAGAPAFTGDVPDTLNLEAFKNRRIPLDWRDQRRYFQLAS